MLPKRAQWTNTMLQGTLILTLSKGADVLEGNFLCDMMGCEVKRGSAYWWWSRQAGVVWLHSSLEASLHCPAYPFSWWSFSLKTCFTRQKKRILYLNSQTSALPKKPLYKMHCRPPVTLLIMWVNPPKCIYSVSRSSCYSGSVGCRKGWQIFSCGRNAKREPAEFKMASSPSQKLVWVWSSPPPFLPW